MKTKLWKSIVVTFLCSALMISIPVKAAENENAQKLKDGSFAYFQDKGAAEALNALENSTYANLTIKGDAADATNFSNMLATFQWIRECNRLRELNNLEPLLVNDTLMAMAEADANYSDTVVGHAEQFSVGENCAWNFGSNPFAQWYDEEKAIYDAMETPAWTNETGHYLNIINPSYTTTGFAISTRGTIYPYTYVQVFSTGEGISVDEYEKQVLEYYNSLQEVTPTPTPTPTGTPDPTPTGTPTPTPTGTPDPTPTGTPAPMPTGTPGPAPTGTPAPIPGGSGSNSSNNNTTTKQEYKVKSGAGSVWTKGSGQALVITTDGDFNKFFSVAIDGAVIDKSNYDAWSGSTVVSLKPEFLETLNAGEHTYRVYYTDGQVDTTFKVEGATSTQKQESSSQTQTTSTTQASNTTTGNKTPQTGDNTTVLMAAIMMLVSAAGIVLSLKARKRV